MRRVVPAAIAFALVMPARPVAHRLDEYLQAARLSLARDRITLEVGLTPGANIASAIVSLLDRDGDNTISPIEAAAYGRVVLADLVLELDGRPVALTLTHVEAPSIDEMRDGFGTIQVRAVGTVEAVAAGRRRLDFRNNHQTAGSVYLANALIPDDGDVAVVAQTRDPRQQGVHIEYDVRSRWPVRLLWLVVGAAAVSTLMVRRRIGHARRAALQGPHLNSRCRITGRGAHT
jgi:hypothetical protein